MSAVEEDHIVFVQEAEAIEFEIFEQLQERLRAAASDFAGGFALGTGAVAAEIATVSVRDRFEKVNIHKEVRNAGQLTGMDLSGVLVDAG